MEREREKVKKTENRMGVVGGVSGEMRREEPLSLLERDVTLILRRG